ncbi:MAG: hypothetical protein GVY25_00335 [Bacteroidetes bacterium]|jgi:GGDEF domain-containing protein|nr:hypothetical protein [Bacteroidota bacterium]
MIRALLVVLVVLIAVLAFWLDHTWVYALSGLSLLAALGWAAVYGWREYHRRQRKAARETLDREHRLQDFGIVSIRPQQSQSPRASGGSGAAAGSQRSGTAQASRGGTRAANRDGNTERQPAGGSPSASGSEGGGSRPVAASAGTATASTQVSDSSAAVATDEADKTDETDAAGVDVADVDAEAEASTSTSAITTTDPSREPVLVPLVESLRVAVDAHSVCLLVQEDVVLEYHIRAIASRSSEVKRDGVFSTNDPLLTASMSRQPISVRRIEGGRDVVAGYLRYYDEPPSIDHIALAPVKLRDTATTTFMLVDATEGSDLGAPNARAIIEQYAETVALVLQSKASGSTRSKEEQAPAHGDSSPSRTGTPRVRESDPFPADADEHPDLFSGAAEISGDGPQSDERADATPSAPGDEEPHADEQTDRRMDDEPETDVADDTETQSENGKPRPRGEIIAEEMEAADRAGSQLALVLVHLNRAEAIARAGDEAVASAEKTLRSRLKKASPEQRVVRFGELTYGVFYRGGLHEVEPWAVNLQQQMDAATGELEGGASIGVALRRHRHETPESLRADATQALREAYETGTCTIVE